MKTFCTIHFVLLSIFFAFTGCRKFKQEKIVAKADPYRVTNLYPIERLPSYFNRVVVLPVFTRDQDSPLLEFADQVFQQEIIQEKIFLRQFTYLRIKWREFLVPKEFLGRSTTQ